MEKILKTFDLTVLDLQMIIVWALVFVVLWRSLSRFFVRPYLKLVEAREAATVAARETAAELNKAADELKEEYDRRLSAERARFQQHKQEALDRAKAEADSIVETAERESRHYRDTFRTELKSGLEELKVQSAAQIGAIAALLVEKLRKIPQENLAGK